MADIWDEQTLKDMEADYTLSRLSDIVVDDSVRRFDFEALCELHHSIFQDVYSWAGKLRIINIEKAVVQWNRRTHTEHTRGEIKQFFAKKPK